MMIGHGRVVATCSEYSGTCWPAGPALGAEQMSNKALQRTAEPAVGGMLRAFVPARVLAAAAERQRYPDDRQGSLEGIPRAHAAR